MVVAQQDMLIPWEMIPRCPKCDAPMEVNKRKAEVGMVEDAEFHAQLHRYNAFLEQHQDDKVLYLEIGIGYTTPQFVKHPFQRMTRKNENALYMTMNKKAYRIPIYSRTYHTFNWDISTLITAALRNDSTTRTTLERQKMYLIEPIRNGEYITDGAIALAMQVYVNQHIFLDEDILFPYYCVSKVEIGRFQNTAIEVNQDYIDKHSIQVVCRDTGGGAVYVDKGAVNMCCILEQDTSIYGDFQRFYQPAIKALHTLGATDVVQSGRNDLTLNGKVSGAAMTLMNNRIYGGYSLLLDVNYEAMDKVLKPNRKKIASKGIKSVRARVGHLREALDEKYRDITIEEFKNLMAT